MQPDERMQLDRAVRARLDELQALIERHVQAPPDENAGLPDEREWQAVDQAVMNKARQERALLERNLDWLASEDAGWCERCGEAIPLQRLLAVPSTRLCVACADSRA